MAIFQPTNIIPASFTQGTVDVNDKMGISWQVNGNSAMTAFQIDFYKNDANSTYVTSTGKITKDNLPSGSSPLPFYGTDRFGNPQFFTWSPNGQTWADWSMLKPTPFSNGNNYKFKITQWYKGDNSVISCQTSVALTVGNTYYFTYNEMAVVFSLPINLLAGTNDIYYSFANGEVWVDTRSKIVVCSGSYVSQSAVPVSAKEVTGIIGETTLGELFISQNTSNVFSTKATPALTIYRSSTDKYGDKIDLLDNVSLKLNQTIAVNSTNYFSYDIRNENGDIITSFASFRVENNAIPSGTVIYYTVSSNSCYYYNGAEKVDLITTVSQTQPTTGNDLGKTQINLQTSIAYFKADYTPETGNPIRWIRWQVATATYNPETKKWIIGEILQDTGDIYTPTLNYEFNGFFNGQQYAIRAIGESESGQATRLQGADESGWIFFTINIENQGEYDGNFTAQCLNKENATLLKWEGVEVIPPMVSPQGYTPTISNGSVMLNGKNADTEYSVTWDKEIVVENNESKTIDINFSAPWTAVWKGEVKATDLGIQRFEGIQTVSNTDNGYLLEYSPDGKYLLQYCFDDKYLKIYDVATSGISLKGYIVSNGSIITTPTQFYEGFVNDFAFNLTKNYLAVGTVNRIFLYSFVDGNISLIYAQPIDISNGALSIAFSPDGNFLGAGGDSNYQATKIYSTQGNTLTYLYDLKDGSGSSVLGSAMAIDFNFDGSLVCFCTTYKAYLYSFGGESATFIQELSISDSFYNLEFSKNKNTDILIVGGDTAYYQLKVNNSGAQLVSTLSDIGNIYKGISRSIAFSPNGDYLLIGGSGYVNWYKIEDGISYQGKINTSTWGNVIAVSWNPIINQIAIHNDGADNYFNQIIKPISEITYFPQGKLFELKYGEELQKKFFNLTATNNVFTLNNGPAVLASFTYPKETLSIAIIITPTIVSAYFYNNGSLLFQSSTPTTYAQQPITSVSIYGGNSGTTVNSVSVFQGDGSNIFALYNNPYFESVWNSSQYSLYMTANFNGNLEGGTGTATGSGFRVYRQEVGKNILTPIATVPSTTTSLKDYGITSRKAYKYSLYAYDNNGAFMNALENDTVVATCFKNYSLLVCDYDETKDEYHVRKQYIFALNLSAGSVGNNNKPTLNANFTPYPTRMGDTANYASGTLQGLIGAIYTVPALIEQIGNYKWTAKPSTMDYFDNVDLEKELYDLSVEPYQLFLRDMKGHLRMIATSGSISMTPNLKQKQQSISISFPWVEIGDASDVTIIQTPDDYGWNNDNQVLDVQLDVDVETGELSATYPFPYSGTKFYLTGVNKENLTAKTPLEVTPAQFSLSEVAEEPDDGKVTATVTVNAENN